MPSRMNLGTAAAVTLALTVAAGTALAAETGFESLGEDIYSTVLEVDGLTFFDADIGTGPTQVFAIDDATNIWQVSGGMTDFVDGHTCNINGVMWGPDGYLFCALSSLKVTTGRIENYGALSVAYMVADDMLDFSDNTVTLEALLDDQVVDSVTAYTNTVLFDSGRLTMGACRLELSGVDFDTLRLVSDGPTNGGNILGGIDNVVLSTIPAPSSLALLAAAGLLRRRRA